MVSIDQMLMDGCKYWYFSGSAAKLTLGVTCVLSYVCLIAILSLTAFFILLNCYWDLLIAFARFNLFHIFCYGHGLFQTYVYKTKKVVSLISMH